MSDNVNEIDARKKELLELEKETTKERQKILALVMEREVHLEKRERAVLDREKEVRDKELKLDQYKEKLLAMTQKIKDEAKNKA
ncbi:MAG: hypothetical protein KAJ64_00440 [Thermoplasmata archaeon]|nr:hypothetical protein [Thermoplasmata archaeon]